VNCRIAKFFKVGCSVCTPNPMVVGSDLAEGALLGWKTRLGVWGV